MLLWRLRIAALWIFLAVGSVVGVILLMFEPGVIRDLMAGQWLGMNAHSAGLQITLAINWAVPLAMAFLTLILRDGVNRVTNAVIGALFAADFLLQLTGALGGTFGGAAFLTVVLGLVSLLIVWHTWRWPRPAEVTPPRQRREAVPGG